MAVGPSSKSLSSSQLKSLKDIVDNKNLDEAGKKGALETQMKRVLNTLSTPSTLMIQKLDSVIDALGGEEKRGLVATARTLVGKAPKINMAKDLRAALANMYPASAQAAVENLIQYPKADSKANVCKINLLSGCESLLKLQDFQIENSSQVKDLESLQVEGQALRSFATGLSVFAPLIGVGLPSEQQPKLGDKSYDSIRDLTSKMIHPLPGEVELDAFFGQFKDCGDRAYKILTDTYTLSWNGKNYTTTAQGLGSPESNKPKDERFATALEGLLAADSNDPQLADFIIWMNKATSEALAIGLEAKNIIEGKAQEAATPLMQRIRNRSVRIRDALPAARPDASFRLSGAAAAGGISDDEDDDAPPLPPRTEGADQLATDPLSAPRVAPKPDFRPISAPSFSLEAFKNLREKRTGFSYVGDINSQQNQLNRTRFLPRQDPDKKISDGIEFQLCNDGLYRAGGTFEWILHDDVIYSEDFRYRLVPDMVSGQARLVPELITNRPVIALPGSEAFFFAPPKQET